MNLDDRLAMEEPDVWDPDTQPRRRPVKLTAHRSRRHYMARIAVADNPRLRLNEAIDYLRAALARAPERLVNQAVDQIIDIADRGGDL